MSKNPSPTGPPVSMPTVVLDVHDDGTITVTVDEMILPPPPDFGVWRRGAFAQIIDTASQDRAFPVRVEVHENDGSTFTDIVPAIIRRTPAPDPLAPDADLEPDTTADEDEKAPAVATHAGVADRVEITAGRAGFKPGEAVAVAVITGQTEATEHGEALAQLDRDLVDGLGISEVILLGRASGTLTIRELS